MHYGPISGKLRKVMKTKPSRIIATVVAGIVGWISILPSPGAAPQREKSSLSREPGAIYFEDFTDKRVELLAIRQDPIYATAQRKRALGVLKKSRKVIVLAMTEKQYMIRGMALHGQVKGWVFPSSLASLDKEFVANLRALYERQKVVEDLIKNHQIALGMTTEEVIASMGKPGRKHSKLDKGGRKDVYDYVTFERIPQYQTRRDAYGNLIRQKYYIKVESGKLSVTFKNEVVQSIEETEGNPLGGDGAKIVPIPIELF